MTAFNAIIGVGYFGILAAFFYLIHVIYADEVWRRRMNAHLSEVEWRWEVVIQSFCVSTILLSVLWILYIFASKV